MKNSRVNWKDRMAALRIVVVYAIIGGLWILCSDTVLGWIIHDSELMTRIAIYKGLFFVLATAILLYHLIARHVLRLTEANRQIAASEERFQAINDNMLEAVLLLDPASGKIVDVNLTTCELFGYSRSEALLLTIRQICSGDSSFSKSEPMESLARAAKGMPQLIDRVARRKDGSFFWVSISMRKAAIGGEERVIALVRDISERKGIEEKLRLTEFAVENMPDAVEWLTMDARFWKVNSAACEMVGYSLEEMLSFSLADIDPYFTLEGWQSNLEKLKLTGSFQHSRYHKNSDGHIFPVEITSNYFVCNGKEFYCAIVRDISERVQFEEEVSFFKKLVESSRDCVYVLSPRLGWRMVYANQAACAHYGMTLEELQQKSISDWDPDFDMGKIDVLWQQLKQGRPIRFETRHRIASGELVTVEVTANCLKHGGEELAFGYFYEITERKRAEEELRKSEGHLRTLVQTLPDLVWLKDKDGVYLSCNQMFERFFGAREADIVGKTDYDFVDKELADFFVENDRKAMAAGKPTSNEEWITFADDGRSSLLETIKTPMYDDRGELIGVLGIGRDITERKRVEEELRESEARYRGLVELFPEAIYIHAGGKLVFANSNGARLVGAENSDDLYGREALDFVHPDCRDFVTKRIKSAYELGISNPPVEEVFLRLDGLPVQVEVSSNAFSYHGEKALQIVARDISERKKRQEELVRAQKLESLGVLAGGIAHDFNNLLTGIMGNLSMMREELPPDHPLQGRLIRCEKAIKQTTGLTSQLLTFSRGGEPVKKIFDLRPVLQDTISFALRGSNVALELDIADDLWLLEADAGQLCQVFNNLIINASQAMPGGGTVRVEVCNCHLSPAEVPPLDPGDYLLISVIDHGTGIPLEYLDKIFDPYFTTKETGSGLGLTSIYSIVRKHRGQVLVSSRMGVGTLFHVYLPACPKRGVPEPPAETVANSGVSIKGSTVLLMDDEKQIRDLSEEMLLLLGCRVETCSSGEELIDQYRRRIFDGCKADVVIMDLTIPGKMGGLEAAKQILEIDPEARLIVSSGYSNDPVMANYHAYGFVDFLVKPYRLDDLSDALSRVLQ